MTKQKEAAAHAARLQLHADAAQTWSGKARALTLALVGLYVAARLWRLTQFNLGRDELFSLETARLGWRALLGAVVADVVHPPLFYLLLKLWLAIGGERLGWLKLFPALAAILAVVPLLLLCRELRAGAFATNVAVALVAVNGYLVAYAHELRMYSLLLLFSLCALWLFVRFWHAPTLTRRALLALFAAHLLLVYTQYYGWLVVGVETLFVLGWRHARARTFALLVAGLALSFAPWVWAVAHALSTRTVALSTQLSWHYRPDAAGLAAYYALLNGPYAFAHSTTLGLLGFGLLVGWACWDAHRSARAEERPAPLGLYFLLALAVLPVAFAFAISRLSAQSIWHTRYLIISAVPYLLLVAAALARLRPRRLRWAITLAVVAWATLSGCNEMRRTDTHVAWDVLARELSAAEAARARPVKVYMLDDFPRYPMSFYLHAAGDDRFEFVRVSADAVLALADDHFWLVYDEGAWPPDRQSPPEIMRGRGLRVGPAFDSGPRGHRYVLVAIAREGTRQI